MEKQGLNQRNSTVKGDAITQDISEFTTVEFFRSAADSRWIARSQLLQCNFCDFRRAIDSKRNADGSNAACNVHLRISEFV